MVCNLNGEPSVPLHATLTVAKKILCLLLAFFATLSAGEQASQSKSFVSRLELS